MEFLLDASQNFRIRLENVYKGRVRLLHQIGKVAEGARPACEVRTAMGGPQERDRFGALEDLHHVRFGAVFGCEKHLEAQSASLHSFSRKGQPHIFNNKSSQTVRNKEYRALILRRDPTVNSILYLSQRLLTVSVRSRSCARAFRSVWA